MSYAGPKYRLSARFFRGNKAVFLLDHDPRETGKPGEVIRGMGTEFPSRVQGIGATTVGTGGDWSPPTFG